MTDLRHLYLLSFLAVQAPILSAQEAIVEGASMAHERGTRRGFVVAAPHHGYEFGSGEIATAIAMELGAGRVVATDYRDPDRRRWICVNRPLECLWAGGTKGDETRTERATTVYLEYQRRIFDAAGVERGPIALLVEIHGSGRKAGGGRPLAVIETATRGFDPATLRRLEARWRGPAPIVFDALPEHARFEFEGREYPFHWTAGGAKAHGSLRPDSARRALHFELPSPLRERAARDGTARALADLVAAALEETDR